MSLWRRGAAKIALPRQLARCAPCRRGTAELAPGNVVGRSVREVLALLGTHGGEHVESMRSTHTTPLSVTPLEHSLRAAALAAELDMGEDLVIAALLHDCGHLIPRSSQCTPRPAEGPSDHHLLGSGWLRSRGFSQSVCGLVALNVDAKRFLCRADPGYHGGMSDAAKADLEHHGGAMAADEAEEFQGLASFEASMALRHCCDAAASSAAEGGRRSSDRQPRLGRYRGLLEDHLGEQLADHCWWEDLGQEGTYHVKRG